MPEASSPRLKFAKPDRGTSVLEKAARDAEADRVEQREKAAARKRDGRCRWPSKHLCRGGLEAAHLRDASLGGEMAKQNLWLCCAWIHRRGPESIHGKQLRIEAETPAGTDGPCSFWRHADGGWWYLVAREVAPFIYERD